MPIEINFNIRKGDFNINRLAQNQNELAYIL